MVYNPGIFDPQQRKNGTLLTPFFKIIKMKLKCGTDFSFKNLDYTRILAEHAYIYLSAMKTLYTFSA